MHFEAKTGYIRVIIGDRTQEFRVAPANGYSVVEFSAQSTPWRPSRIATPEEEVMYTALRNMHEAVTQEVHGKEAGKP